MSTLRLVKSVANGTATADQWTLTGTGPDTISGAGDTGVVTVADGTYVLSETGAPTGYTGTWNCGAATMPTPTSVIVGAGAAAVAPVQIPSDHAFTQFLNSQKPDYFEVGTDLYRVLVNGNTLGMFKRAAASTGGAWTLMDAANSPDAGNQSRFGRVTVSGTTISVAYLLGGQLQMKICTYNTTTDTWGSPTPALTLPAALSNFAFMQQSSGTYTIWGMTTYRTYYATCSGSWSALGYTLVSGGNVIDGVIDGSDNYHLLLNIQTSGVGNGLEYRRVPSTFGLGTPYPVATSYSGHPSIILWDSTHLAIGFIDNFGVPARKAQVMIGTPLSAPSFTNYVIATPTGSSDTFDYVHPAVGIAADLNVFYTDTSASTLQVMQSTFDGVSTWSAPAQFYDAVTHPPSNGVLTVNQSIQGTQAIELAAGWTVATAMNTNPGSISTGELLEGVTSSAEVVCTLTNTFSSSIPPYCVIYTPTTSTPTLVAYDEPLELQGS